MINVSEHAVAMRSSPHWGDWKFQMKNLIRTIGDLEKWINVSESERAGIAATSDQYRWMVTPYYASLMDWDDGNCPIRLQSLPSRIEAKPPGNSHIDPVGDMTYSKTRRVIHKYPNRIVLLVSDTCPVYCRHCTRKYHTTANDGTYFNSAFSTAYEEDFAYIRAHPEINDVLLTGGDPLTLTDRKLEEIIAGLRSIPHVKIVRLGSRYPVFMPQRITPELCGMLERYHPVWLNTHFNHPVEITEEAGQAVDRLLRSGIPVQNQSVLLRGINDDLEVMRQLNRRLLEIRVRPYYLYHADNVTGVSHFRTSIAKGLEIMEGLVGHETGFSVPSYVLTTDIGKIPIGNTYYEEDGLGIRVRNYKREVRDVSEYVAL